MEAADLTDGLRFCRASGWNQEEADWRAMLALGGGRFRVAVEGGRVVGTGGTVAYGSRLGWICMILVDPERRGRGIGTRVFEDVLAHAGGLDVLGLDATAGGRPIYERAGFREAYGLARLEREPHVPTDSPSASSSVQAELRDGAPAPGVSAAPARSRARRPILSLGGVRPRELEAVLAWDREAFGADRGAVLRWALGNAPEYAYGAFGPDGAEGYALGRHGHRFEHLGPVVARDAATAEALVSAALAPFPDRRFGIDVPTDRPEWRAALDRLGFREKRSFTRMYRTGEGDPGRRDVVFAVAGPEFG
jgi:GNAT superfamily N-acetyltransferase